MTQEQTVLKKRRRVPKPGTWFGILRVFGIIQEVIGGFIIAASAIWLIVLLVRLGPDLVAILTSSGISQTGGFVLMGILVWLFIPMFFGCIGIFLASIGFVCCRLATTRQA